MRRTISWMLVLLLTVSVLGGCSGNDPAPVVEPPMETEEPSEEEENTPDDIDDQEEEEDQEVKPSGGYDSPIPDADTFVERYNQAAVELNTPELLPEDLEPLSWNSEGGLTTIEGGFNCTIPTGAIMFDPYYVRIVARMDDMSDVILVYAATASAVTGLPAEECLAAMTDMVENAEEDTWDNGYEVNLGDAVLENVLFEYEFGRSTGISQLFVNPEGLMLSHDREDA